MSQAVLQTEAPRQLATSRPHRLRLVALFGFGWVVLTASVMMLNPLLPLIRDEFRLSGAEAGLLASAFYLPYLLMQVPAGLLVDRLGPRRVLIGMALVSGAALISTGLFATTLVVLLLFGLLHRTAAGVFYPAAFGLTVRSVPPGERGTSSAVLSGGMALGSGVGVAMAVPLALAGGTWRFPYLVVGLAMLSLALPFAGLLRRDQLPPLAARGHLRQALADPVMWMLFLNSMCVNYAFTALITWGPSFLHLERGLPLTLAALLTALFSFVGVPIVVLIGRLSDLVGRRWLTIALGGVSTIAMVVLTASPEISIVLMAVLLYGCTGKWASDGAQTPWIGDLASARYPAATSAVFGFNNMCRMLGGMLSPPIAGALFDLTGSFQAGLYLGAAVLVVGSTLVFFTPETER